jgi:hypothetical protein
VNFDFPFSRWREKVPKADEGGAGGFDNVRTTLTPTLSCQRERGKSEAQGVRSGSETDSRPETGNAVGIRLHIAIDGAGMRRRSN